MKARRNSMKIERLYSHFLKVVQQRGKLPCWDAGSEYIVISDGFIAIKFEKSNFLFSEKCLEKFEGINMEITPEHKLLTDTCWRRHSNTGIRNIQKFTCSDFNVYIDTKFLHHFEYCQFYAKDNKSAVLIRQGTEGLADAIVLPVRFMEEEV